MNVDPRTPVIVGVGQSGERIADAGYCAMSAVDLATAAARSALEDCEASDVGAVARSIDTVVGTRQFEISGLPGPVDLGKSTNYPRSVAFRLDADPARAVLDVIGGEGPQRLVNEFAASIAAGDTEVAMLFGSDNSSTLRHLADAKDKPDFSETVNGQLEDRGLGWDEFIDPYIVIHGLTSPAAQHGVMENARRARVGASRGQYLEQMAQLFAPFSKIAAQNPLAASPVERSVAELITVDDSNRMICDPYPRLLLARDQVNQGAAVLIMSVDAARRLGVPEEKWVYLSGHADLRKGPLLERADLSRSPAAAMAVREGLSVAGVGINDITTFDLYSCFAVPVFNVCDHVALDVDDPRGLTVTGGLPFFGGAGNNYAMHAIAETVRRMRDSPGQLGLVGANGGIMSKYSVGVYSTAPSAWRADRSVELQAQVAGWPKVAVTETADGAATIETYTVHYDWPTRTGVIIGRLHSDDSRFMAITEDEDLVGLLTEGEPLGAKIVVRSSGHGNRASLD